MDACGSTASSRTPHRQIEFDAVASAPLAMNRRKAPRSNWCLLAAVYEAPIADAGIRKLTVKSFAREAFTSNRTTLSNGYRLFCVSPISAPSCVRSEFKAFTGVRFERRESLDFSSSGKDHPLRSDKDHLVPSPVPRFPAPAGTSGLETSWDPQVSKPPAY